MKRNEEKFAVLRFQSATKVLLFQRIGHVSSSNIKQFNIQQIFSFRFAFESLPRLPRFLICHAAPEEANSQLLYNLTVLTHF